MCYSAQLVSEFEDFIRHGGRMSLKEFAEIYGHRIVVVGTKIPRVLDKWFESDPNIGPSIARFRDGRREAWQAELDKQGARLTAANRALETKPTKKADSDQRIAAKKIKQLRRWLEDLDRVEPKADDARIFPQWYAPVITLEGDQRIVRPMRYQCRPEGKPEFYDTKYPGCYNARRDNLEGFWKGQFGVTHGVMLATAFYENVSRHRFEGRERAPGEEEENVVIKFEPDSHQLMLVACLWSHWSDPTGKQPDLLSFAAITDEPPPEVAAAGHDRCIIPLKPEHVDAWLRGGTPAEMYKILDDRERPYYEHQIAKAA